MKFRNIEISIATVLLLIAIYSLFGSVNIYWTGRYSENAWGMVRFREKGLHFNFFVNYMLPFIIVYVTVYASFIWVACSLPNKFITAQKWYNALLTIIAGILVTWGLFVLKDCLDRPYDDNVLPDSLFRELGVAVAVNTAIVGYVIFKQFVFWALTLKQVKASWKTNTIVTDIIWFLLLWGIAMFGIAVFEPYWGFAFFLALIIPCCFIIYLVCFYHIIPKYYQQNEKGPFWLTIVLISLAINIPFNGAYSARASYSGISFVVLFSFIWMIQIAVIVPISLYLYKVKRERSAELNNLKTELGTSNAGLQFLRSQINPHFLFNALNTLYGTALMENAEKTGEGIQKLGDMMRFMLHENNQDKIALSREINYLHNYIDLQNLRIASSPNINIEILIEDIIGYYEIGPMLLIPFIENAYKHGISLKEKSWIKVNLFKQDDTLHLDVHNSIHPEKENDPERYHSGTGLDNVKQRLQLLYPQRHELVIRKNTQEFFIHLSLTLTAQKS
ncbi:histidine kinase [Mucilaginibacter sp. BJC16-A38]|uniref:sensor histidine kinase n=1 Tax=Mucilaginibacter phenanthrenivorans TaxID=1234842 RepID=UPI002157F69E|nr:histidine kinase [Mucilaginibacter phenanthrenivorans]MCR8559943.1 histidine kinase [Mucilaginibacter phenanthrenivorans]